jgi:hypothetical protein
VHPIVDHRGAAGSGRDRAAHVHEIGNDADRLNLQVLRSARRDHARRQPDPLARGYGDLDPGTLRQRRRVQREPGAVKPLGRVDESGTEHVVAARRPQPAREPMAVVRHEEHAAVRKAREVSGPAVCDDHPGYQDRLAAIDPGSWPIEQQVDYHLLRAEMNGLDFHLRVLRPWARDPAFYASVRTSESDTPAEEGPTIHHAVRLWQYSIWSRTSLSVPSPLTPEGEAQLAAELRTVPPLLDQARGNLAGSNAADLWVAGIRSLRNQSAALVRLAGETEGAGRELTDAVRAAREATEAFAAWLEREAPSKTGPSGIGKEHYTWHLRNVLLVPLSWEEEVTIMQRELARAHASLRLEEHRNRDLPPLDPVSGPEEFARLQDETIVKYLKFLEERDILPVEPYMERALRERTFDFSPEAARHFFHQASHREPTTLWTHFYHWWDLGADGAGAAPPARCAVARCSTTSG